MKDIDECIEEIKQLEELFSANQYDGSGEHPFTIEEGSLPVIVSAPHAVNQFQKGRMKGADMFTGGIARYLHQETGCHLMYSSRFSWSDPNFDPVGANRYQETLKEYLEEHRIEILLDLHGAAETREFAVEMGTAPEAGAGDEPDPSLHEHKYVAGLIKDIFEERFKNCPTEKNKVWKNRLFSAGIQNTITKSISKNTDTACIQLEINRRYRKPEHREEFAGLVESLEKIINTLAVLTAH